jgi:hypothetical protein
VKQDLAILSDGAEDVFEAAFEGVFEEVVFV